MPGKVLSVILISFLFTTTQAQELRSRWIDSVFSTLSRESKVGQLFMIPVSSHATPDEIQALNTLVKSNQVGSLYITGGGPVSHARLINQLQKTSKIPLLVGISAEWGLGQTLDSTLGFQKPMVSAAWKVDSLRVVWASEIAREMKLLGFHINFAPNADNEIFSGDYLRYFSNREPALVHHALLFAQTMQAGGIMSVVKHLPRKLPPEQSTKDSTLVLHVDHIDTAGFYAFKNLIEYGVGGILTSYLHFSTINEKGMLSAPLSSVFLSDILRTKLGYKGIVFTEVRNFKQTGPKVRSGDAELLAIQTGNDVLMAPLDIAASIKKISRQLKKDKLLQQQVDASVKKVLAAKYDAGLHHVSPIDTDNLFEKLHTRESLLLKHRLTEAAVTMVKNENNFLPIQSLENRSFVALSVGADGNNDFTRYLKKYSAFRSLSLKTSNDTTGISFNENDIVVIGVFPYADDLEAKLVSWINQLSTRQDVVVVHFGNPLSISRYTNATSLIAAYEIQDYMPEVVPQVIFGALPAHGVLPVAWNDEVKIAGIETLAIDRLSYSFPEASEMDSRTLDKVKTIMKEAIDMGATPGCHVIVARKGRIVYDQSAGWLTYENKTAVSDETMYDLASLTKVSATLQAAMFLQERGLIDINKKASVYLPELKNTNKKDITIIDMLTHQSGLVAFIPLWPLTMKDSLFLPQYYSRTRDENYPLQVAPDLFASHLMRDSVWYWIAKSKMQEKPARTPFAYRYSDLGFMIMKQLAERILNQPLDEFLYQNLYEPLGAYTTGFNPLDRFSIDRIAPTEIDKIYRKSTVLGTVHDERAAMMGGVSGHAGLFSTANDLAKLGQMLLQEGHYGGETYYKPETVRLFSMKQFQDSRRGLGWDKPVQGDWTSPTSLFASPRTFGHTGFTGTCLWIDPEFELVYIFVSNRVYPDRSNKLLVANIRSRIQDVIYRSIFDYCAVETSPSSGPEAAGQ